MIERLGRIADLWIARRARPRAGALAEIAGLLPIVVVTGGSTGIGLALARRFAAAGHHVAIVARTPELLAAAAEAVRARPRGDGRHRTVLPVTLDITAPDAGDALDATLRAAGFYPDILVNNAGIGMAGAFVEGDPSRLEAMLAVNVAALARLTRRFLPAMLARGRGGVLNVASLGGYTPGPYQAAYYASKAFVLSFTEAVGHEIAGRGVRCCVVAPGPVATGFHTAMGARRSPYRLALPSSSADGVARSAYRGFRLGRRVVVPGPIAALLMPFTRAIPHPVLVPILGALLKPWRRS